MLTVEILQLPALRFFLQDSSTELTASYQLSQFNSAGLESSLYSFGVDPTENTGSNSLSIVLMGGCLADSPDIV
jgi:hypothetical protein